MEGTNSQPPEAPRCFNCEIEFAWPAVSDARGASYCCIGCAQGGPCTCGYEEVWQARPAIAARSAVSI